MKKVMSLFLTIALVIGILPVINIPIVFAEDDAVTATSQDSSALWDWETFGDGVQLTKYKGTQTDVYVPSKVEKDGAEYSVLKLGDNLFKDNTSINSVTLGEGITEIGASAFRGATNLVCIVTNQTLTTIGDSAFSGCTVFNSIILYDTVTNIGTDVFKNCTKVTVYCNESTPIYDYVKANNIPYKILNPDAEPEIVTVDGIEYYIMNGEAIAFSFNGSSKKIVIPATVSDYPVTELRSAFKNNANLTSVTLPNSLKKIGNYVFEKCTGLTNVTIPNGVTSIGNSAFHGCSSLTDITIPNSVISIGTSVFYGCSKLTGIIIPNSITSIGYSAFYGCNNLTSITIPNSVTSIGSYAFGGCSNLTNITIPNSVTSIGSYAFGRCSNLTNIAIPNSVTSIRTSAFCYCTSLTSVTIPNGVTTIGNEAFQGCYNLTSVTIPDSVTTIGASAFASCTSLTSVTIPDSVTTIGTSAFGECTSLTSVIIPSSVTNISSISFTENTIWLVYENSYAHTFAVNNDLLYFMIEENSTPEIYTVDGITYYILNNEAIAISFDKSTKTVTIPSAVEGYPVTQLRKTFYNCTSLTSVTLPESLKIIGDEAFYECKDLTNVTIPNGVTTIGDEAFHYCYNLTGVTIPNSVTSIGYSAFRNCTSLTSVTIPNSVTSIGASAFASCTSLTSVTIPNSVTSIGNYMFQRCKKLTRITIPDSVTTIGSYAFGSCSNLTNITIPDGVTTIGGSAFFGCSNLTDVTIPDSVTSIGSAAFRGCRNLTSITIPNKVTSIKDETFRYCTNLTSVTIANSVTSIGNYAFGDCSKLTSVTIPNKVTSVGISAFEGCIGLFTVVIPESVTYISSNSTHENTIWLVHENSYAHTFAVNNDVLYLVIEENTSPEICTVDGITYYILNNEAIAISFDNSTKTVTIPSTIKGYPVTKLRKTFYNCTSLTSVTLPESLKLIGDEAFYGCTNLTGITIPSGVTSIGDSAFYSCSKLTGITIPDGVTSVGYSAFRNCTKLTNVKTPNSVTSIGIYAFYGCTDLTTMLIPESVTRISSNSLPENTIWLVYENSSAYYTVAVYRDLLYFVLHKTENPEISYGAGITGTATYTDGTAVSGATVEILYDDGTVKESVTTDETGAYSFTYAEVGRYTIRVTDASGNTGSEVVSVKRMNVFDVYLAGETDIVIKKGYTVSGTVSPTTATITLTDSDGNVISSTETADGTYSIVNVPNGTYILKAETEKGTATKEITVFNGDVSVDKITVASESAAVTGYVEVEDREFKHHKRNWVNITIYNEDGVEVASQKSDKDGNYAFTNLPLGEYSIVAETNEMRPDKKKGFDRSHKLTGYAYVNVTEAKTYSDVNIVLYEENDYTATISGKVTAKGETQDCEVILTNVFKHEIARYETGKNGKYTFKNIPDGLYFITAITKSDGMGFAVVVVHNGKVYSDTDITISKPQKFYDRETKMNNDIPHCNNRDDALKHRERIAEEKRYYDGLSPKEKKHFSKEYVERLNRLCEWIADSSYTSTGDVKGTIENEGTIISGDELDLGEKIEFVLNISETSEHTIPDDGIKTREEFEQQSINDTAGDKHIAKYYDISLSKNGKAISNVQKHTDTTGKLRITMEIPEEYRGHKHYSFVHMHNGEPTTLVDLDDDPNTVTFEIDKFSTFALAYSDVELTEASEYPATITYDETTGKITVSSSQAGTLYIATFDGARFVSVEKYEIPAGTVDSTYSINTKQAAFVWDDNLTPLSKKFEIENN